MSDQITKLRKRIEKIEALKMTSPWGPEYQLWKDLTEKLVKEIFGSKGLRLFKQQNAVVLDNDAYIRELNGRKHILEGLIENQDEYKPDIEDKQNKKEPAAVRFTESARNNVFINSQIHGGVEIDGQGNSFIETKINTLKKEHPFWFWFGTLGTLIGIITGLMFLAQYFGILSNSWSSNLSLISTRTDIATTTPKVSDIFSRYNEMDRALDQQNFLKDYIGVTVYGTGTFNNIAGSFGMDNNYYLYLNTPGALVSCGFENVDEVTKRRLDLLRAANRVSFLGTFTGSTLNGGNSWYMRDCSFAN